MAKQYRLQKLPDFQLLKDRVYEAIKKNIIDLSLLPNEQLVEQRLAEELGVSKSPIREALLRLEREGLVYTLPFKGCFVAGITEKDIREVFQLREALETFCVKYASESFSKEEMKEVKKILSEAEKAVHMNDAKLFNLSSIQFHEIVISRSKNIRIVKTYSTLRDHLDRYRNIAGRILGRMAKSHHEHIMIMEALEQRDGVQAERRMSSHLRDLLEEFLQSKEFKSFCKNRQVRRAEREGGDKLRKRGPFMRGERSSFFIQ